MGMGRFGGMGELGARSVEREKVGFGGGPNEGFMHMINTLALEEPEEVKEESADEEGASAESTSLSTSANEPHSSEDEGPPSFLSPLQPIAQPAKEESEGEDMMSSIYAIHRPIAARRRTVTGEEGECVKEGRYAAQRVRSGTTDTMDSGKSASRRQKLAEKLEDVFGIEGGEEVLAEFQCWLFRSVLLQGFMYLTSGHICFYAYLPHKEGTTVRSGGLSARGLKTRRYYKHWFILKDAVLSWYPSSTDPYFPDGHIDLHYCTGVEPSLKHKNHFKVATAEKTWHLSADSEASRDEWVKVIKKVVFRCQNEGESVKISIPLETVIDIERSTNLKFAETVRVRVYDAEEGYSVDEYWLSYFSDLPAALDKMTQVLTRYRAEHPEQARQAAAIIDTTSRVFTPRTEGSRSPRRAASLSRAASPQPSGSLHRAKSTSSTRSSKPHSASSWSALSSRLRIFSTTDRASSSIATLTEDKSGATTPKRSGSPSPARRSSFDGRSSLDGSGTDDHTYPPDPTPGTPPPDLTTEPRHSTSSWSIPSMPSLTSVPTWLKGPQKRVFAASPTIPNFLKVPGRKILEVVTPSSEAAPGEEDSGEEGEERRDMSYSILEEQEGEEGGEEEKVNEKFRKLFGLTEKEEVVAYFPAYLFRGLPIYGKVYISTTFFCFKSFGLLARIKMILPLSDVIAVSKHRSYRIGYSGLIVVIKGHEELFFELSTSERRDLCMQQLEAQVEFVQHELAEGKTPGDTLEHQEHMDLLDLAASRTSDASSSPRPPPETISGQPPVMFCSTSSDFVTFRPEKSLRFTCLTIGSRGDVQPYIALCKGLMAEGHKCKIASHGEYRNWVEGHGIEFEEVGGDPAELMQLMIAHDFFTISFMKEAVGRFRGWLDDLLETTWKACQGSDVLIESPSAIAGYHIAEALRIPYYRAFTMPWSRTRAYPHAFAVPDHKMGGGYNYMTYTMFDQIFWRATSAQVNRWRKKTLNLGSTSLEAMQQQQIPFLYNFSPVIVPPPLDWRENIHVTGYWWLDNPDDSTAKKWEPPTDLLAFLDLAKAEEKKVVFIGFGSIIIPDPVEMTRVVSRAVEKSGVFAIVAKGWSDRVTSKDDTQESREEMEVQAAKEATLMERSYIFNIKSIPHDWLFPRIDAAVHHGGAGTTGASLRAGLPTIIKPFFGDQHFYADRVATLGIGSAVRNMTVDNLAAAITTAVMDEKQIARAKLAGEAIRKEDGVGNAIECIYRDLEYAKSLVPALRPRPSSTLPTPASAPLSPALPATTPREGSSDEAMDSWDVLSQGSGATWDGEESRASSASRSGPASGRGGSTSEDEGVETVEEGKKFKAVGARV